MKKTVLTVIFLATLSASLPAVATPPRFWSHQFGDATGQFGWSVATDASGSVYIAGKFAGTADFGGGSLTSMGGSDIYLAKFSPAGVHQWSQRFGDASNQEFASVVTDASGNVYLTGVFYGTVNFGGANLISAGLQDIFLAKFNSAGVHQWSQRFGNASDQYGQSVATDVSGNVYLTGYFAGTVNFGGANLTSTGGYDIFLAKFNSAGVHQWSQRFGDAFDQYGFSVATDVSGNVCLTGYFLGTVNFGGANLTSMGGYDTFLAKFNSAGVHQWSQRFGDASDQVGYSVATDASGNVVVTGTFQGVVNFGGTDLASTGSYDLFLAKFNSAGVHQWSQRFGDGPYNQIGYSTATNAPGNIYLVGYFAGTMNFGGGALSSAGSTDAFLAKFDAAGLPQWSYRFGDTNGQIVESVATDASGSVYLTGYFEGTVNFGGASLISAGTTDIFLAKFSGASQPAISSIADIGNDQGRKVKIRFTGSPFDDAGAPSPVVQYEAYRRDDAVPSALAAGSGPVALSAHALRANGWTQVGTVAAHTEATYGIDAPTVGDSTVALGQYYSVFYIRAATATPGTFFDSPADSGYSVDNLAPGVPTSFAYSVGVLSWDESKAADFDYFSVYGSATSSFGAATQIDYTVVPSMDVNASPYVYYFVTATDFSGNEGKPAVVNTLSGVGGTPKNYVLSISSYPNPFNPETTIRYTVPSKGQVTVDVYDASGARVAALVDEEKAAGAYTQAWDGRDEAGKAVSSGVYFARMNHPSGTKSYKMVLLK